MPTTERGREGDGRERETDRDIQREKEWEGGMTRTQLVHVRVCCVVHELG